MAIITTGSTVTVDFILPKGVITGYLADELHLKITTSGVVTTITSNITVVDSTGVADGSVTVTSVAVVEGSNSIALFRTTDGAGSGVTDMDTNGSVTVKIATGVITKVVPSSTLTLR